MQLCVLHEQTPHLVLLIHIKCLQKKNAPTAFLNPKRRRDAQSQAALVAYVPPLAHAHVYRRL